MKKKKNENLCPESMNGFGTYKKAIRKYPIKGYVALTAIAIVISALLVMTLVYYPKTTIPHKKAVFPPDKQKTAGVLDKVINKPDVQRGLGVANLATGNSDKAMEHFNKVIDADPDNPTGYLQRGATLLMNGEIDLGTTDIETAAALNPRFEPIAQKCRMIRNLLSESNIKVSGEQIKQIMAKMSPQDVQRITTQMMTPKENKNEE